MKFPSTEIGELLKEIYKAQSDETIDIVLSQLMQISEEATPVNKQWQCDCPAWDSSSVVLITYPDILSSSDKPCLHHLSSLITNHLGNLAGIVHILPFLCSTSDGGFAVSNHKEIEPKLGHWEDLKMISEKNILMADVVLNHVSSTHPWLEQFKSRLKPGSEFILSSQNDERWQQVFRPRNTPLFKSINTIDGPKNVWTTFGPDQVDVDWSNPFLLIEYVKLIVEYLKNGVRWFRLDAVGFIWKEPYTRCLHNPEAHKIVKLVRVLIESLAPSGVLITETNVPQEENLSYLITGDEANLAYNFPLPPLILEAIVNNKPDLLNQWIEAFPILPPKTLLLNFTASHDGIGLMPLKGLMSQDRINNLLVDCEKKGGLVSHRQSNNGDDEPYELNISWWSAMQNPVNDSSFLQLERFLLSQIFIMCLPGIPAYYLQAILGSENDIENFKRTGHRRNLNRRKFQASDLLLTLVNQESIARTNLKHLQSAIEVRSHLNAFHPESPMEWISSCNDQLVVVLRGRGEEKIWAIHNFTEKNINLSFSDINITREIRSRSNWSDCLSKRIINHHSIQLSPYKVIWLKQTGGNNL